jgi:hypothetical protein
VSPDHSANENRDPISSHPARPHCEAGRIVELTDHDLPSVEGGSVDEGDGAEIEIEITFRRKLAGLRRLPRRERVQALLAAREWRSFALNALREKRRIDRHARYMQRRHNQIPTPR